MKCPRDGTALAKLKILGVDVEKCHRCDGIWCDRGELEVLRDSGELGLEEAIERIYGAPTVSSGTLDGHMRCPKCPDKRLQQFTYTFIKPVRLDRCESCVGVWLDDRELNAIVMDKQTMDPKITPPAKESHLKALLRALGRLLR